MVPRAVFAQLWGDRDRWGRTPRTDDPMWDEWLSTYANFYDQTQRVGIGRVVNGAGYRVIGISRDAVAKLERFAREEHLTFPLLSDPDHAVHDLYGTFGEKQLYGKTVTGAIRSTFVLDEAGVIELALYNVKATGHVNMLRKKLGLAA